MLCNRDFIYNICDENVDVTAGKSGYRSGVKRMHFEFTSNTFPKQQQP